MLQSAVLAHVPHAFTTRLGGVSAGPYASLNFGSPNDLPTSERDPVVNVESNVQRVFAALACSHRTLAQVHQVHGSNVLTLACKASDGSTRGDVDPQGKTVQADAIVTDDPSLLLGVRVADCGPVLLATADGSVVASVHAGWRGVVAGVLPATVANMQKLHASRVRAGVSSASGGGLIAAIGPCLSAREFEVGEDVREEIERATKMHLDSGKHARDIEAPEFQSLTLTERSTRNRPLVDLVRCMNLQLRAHGVRQVDESCHACTAGDAKRFFSHRRDAGRTGRMLAVIGPAQSKE
jgi:YfiH family protein